MSSRVDRRAACILVVVVVCGAWAWADAGSPPDPAAADAMIQRAEQLVSVGDYAGGAAAYAEAAVLAGQTAKGLGASVQAGVNFDLAGQTDLAIQHFDLAIAMPVATRRAEAALETALYGKLLACARGGCTVEALQAVDYLRTGFFYTDKLSGILDVKGQLESLPADQLQAIKSAELEAQALLMQADAKRTANPPATDDALQLIHQIETDFANTGAAVGAAVAEGAILASLKRWDEARALLGPLVARLEAAAPRSQAADEAKSLLFLSTVSRGWELFNQGVKNRATTPPETWQTVRDYCDQALSMAWTQSQVAKARALQVELEWIHGDRARAESLADGFLQEYASADDRVKHAWAVLSLRLVAAEIARLNGKTDKALALNEQVKTLVSELPPAVQQSPDARGVYQRAYYQCFLTLCWVGADRALIRAAGDELMSRFPGTEYANAARAWLHLPASQPAL